jgi:hypothetical protein
MSYKTNLKLIKRHSIGGPMIIDPDEIHPDTNTIEPVTVTGINPNRFNITDSGKIYIQGLNWARNDMMQKYGLTDEEFASLARTAVNIANTESNFGDSERYWFKAQVPDEFIYAGKLLSGDDTALSKGLTQIKYQDDIKKYPELKRRYNGLTEYQIATRPALAARATLEKLLFNDELLGNKTYHYSDGSEMPQEVARYIMWNAGKLTDRKNAPLHKAEKGSFSAKARSHMNQRLFK